MKNRKTFCVFGSASLFILATTMLISTSTYAANDDEDKAHFYFEASLGTSSFSSPDLDSTYQTSSEDRVSNSWSIGSGLALSDYLAFSLSFNQFGKQNSEFIKSGTPTETVSIDSELKSTSFAVVPSLPLGKKTNVYLELGQHFWDIDQSEEIVAATKTVTDGSFDGSDGFYSFGFSYDLTEQINNKIKYSKYQLDGDDFNTVSLSLAYQL